jgi:hypothetical protein
MINLFKKEKGKQKRGREKRYFLILNIDKWRDFSIFNVYG